MDNANTLITRVSYLRTLFINYFYIARWAFAVRPNVIYIIILITFALYNVGCFGTGLKRFYGSRMWYKMCYSIKIWNFLIHQIRYRFSRAEWLNVEVSFYVTLKLCRSVSSFQFCARWKTPTKLKYITRSILFMLVQIRNSYYFTSLNSFHKN
jgi:hypothetical protein